MKQNFTVRQGALDGVEAFLSVAQHRTPRNIIVTLNAAAVETLADRTVCSWLADLGQDR